MTRRKIRFICIFQAATCCLAGLFAIPTLIFLKSSEPAIADVVGKIDYRSPNQSEKYLKVRFTDSNGLAREGWLLEGFFTPSDKIQILWSGGEPIKIKEDSIEGLWRFPILILLIGLIASVLICLRKSQAPNPSRDRMLSAHSRNQEP